MKKITYPLLALLFLMSACYDYEDLVQSQDQLIAVSQVDLNFDFTSVTTFSVSDSIHEIKLDALGRKTENRHLAGYQKDLVIKQMKDRGFTYIPMSEMNKDNLPDLFFDLTYVENKYVSVSGFGWWYGYYDPYWFDYWVIDPFYPYYPISYTYVSSYTAKSLVMDCFYFKDISTPKYNAKSCFTGIVRGVAGNYTERQISEYINQCFDQTPELSRVIIIID
jgi:hypothetical protein